MNAYTYLSVNALTLLFPAIFSFSRRWGVDRGEWPPILLAILLPALPFLAWDLAFTRAGVWGFNADYVTGWGLLGLPLEEVLFFFCIPFACLFIYRCLPERSPLPASGLRLFWIGLAVLSTAAASLSIGRAYSLAVFTPAALAAAWLAWKAPVWAPRFLAAAVLHYIPFLLVNGILTALPVVRYHEGHFSGIRLFTIPLEDAAYSFLLLLANVAVYEALRARARRAA
jgi:lycopene cyclase domain-containing protein